MTTMAVRSTSSETMSVDPIVLRQTATTRLVFYPKWVTTSENPLRGGFRFERKGLNDTWEDFDSKALSTLHKDEGYELNINGDEMAILFSHLEEIKVLIQENGFSYGVRTFDVSEQNAESILIQIGDVENREWVVGQLRRLEAEKFENLGSAIGRAKLENVIEKFESNLDNNEESFWQTFFEENSWMLQQLFAFPVIYLNGETYVGGKKAVGRQGEGGVATDFLSKNGSSGSFAVTEIKVPGSHLIGTCYRGEEGSENSNEVYSMHADLTGGVVQLENQIHTAIDHFKSTLGETYEELNHLNPSGVLIAGTYLTMSDAQRKSFDLFRKSLGKNQIFTFDEVLAKLKLLKTIYEN